MWSGAIGERVPGREPRSDNNNYYSDMTENRFATRVFRSVLKNNNICIVALVDFRRRVATANSHVCGGKHDFTHTHTYMCIFS